MQLFNAQSVSVVIPVFDRADIVLRALASVYAQSLEPGEVIVVDDGSTDGTVRHVRDGFPQVRCIEQPHAGVSAARNRGIVEAQGEWVAFLDSDDEWCERKLEMQLSALAAAPGHRICHTDEVWIRNGRRVNPKHRHAKAGGAIFQRCLPLCAMSPSSVIMHRSLIDEVGPFDEQLPVCEDYDMWLRVCSRHEVLFVPQPLVVKYGGHDDQLSRRFWGMDRFRIAALEKIVSGRDLTVADRRAAIDTLVAKIDVYLKGARKRGKQMEVAAYEEMKRRYTASDGGGESCQTTG